MSGWSVKMSGLSHRAHERKIDFKHSSVLMKKRARVHAHDRVKTLPPALLSLLIHDLSQIQWFDIQSRTYNRLLHLTPVESGLPPDRARIIRKSLS